MSAAGCRHLLMCGRCLRALSRFGGGSHCCGGCLGFRYGVGRSSSGPGGHLSAAGCRHFRAGRHGPPRYRGQFGALSRFGGGSHCCRGCFGCRCRAGVCRCGPGGHFSAAGCRHLLLCGRSLRALNRFSGSRHRCGGCLGFRYGAGGCCCWPGSHFSAAGCRHFRAGWYGPPRYRGQFGALSRFGGSRHRCLDCFGCRCRAGCCRCGPGGHFSAAGCRHLLLCGRSLRALSRFGGGSHRCLGCFGCRYGACGHFSLGACRHFRACRHFLLCCRSLRALSRFSGSRHRWGGCLGCRYGARSCRCGPGGHLSLGACRYSPPPHGGQFGRFRSFCQADGCWGCLRPCHRTGRHRCRLAADFRANS